MNIFKYNHENAKFNRDIIQIKQDEDNEEFYRIYSLMISDEETRTINWGIFYKEYVEDIANLIVSVYNHVAELKLPLLFFNYKSVCFWFEYYIGVITNSITNRKLRKYKNNIEEIFEYIEKLDDIRFKKELQKELTD